jgi:hypothetical protein
VTPLLGPDGNRISIPSSEPQSAATAEVPIADLQEWLDSDETIEHLRVLAMLGLVEVIEAPPPYEAGFALTAPGAVAIKVLLGMIAAQTAGDATPHVHKLHRAAIDAANALTDFLERHAAEPDIEVATADVLEVLKQIHPEEH